MSAKFPPLELGKVPELGEIFGRLYPEAGASNDERILLEGMLCGMVARLEGDLLKERERFKRLLSYACHTGCARNGLGGSHDACTCGLDAVLAGQA